MKFEAKLWPLEGKQGFKIILSYIIHFQTWLRYYANKHSDKVSWFEAKLWPLEGEQGFKDIWPSDLVFDLTWPIFELERDIIMSNILVKFHEDCSKTVASRGWTT